MKKLFFTGIMGLALFEIANVYFIMPLPGSQQSNSIDVAYFLYSYRWYFRILFALILLFGLLNSNWNKKWAPAIPLLILTFLLYMGNFKMAADAMFTQPDTLTLASAQNNKVDSNRLVIGVVNDGIAKAYPIQFLGYHHFVYDTINGKNILVTYCTVCRTGRVFDPTVDGRVEKFRLVGMDHYNAMMEDATTKSWWRQSTGEAITGKMKGRTLNEVFSTQTTLSQWLSLYPMSKIMQANSADTANYGTTFHYESGKSRKKLTGTDSLSWNNKSWVVGVKIDSNSIAYDWNELMRERVIPGKLGNTNFFVILANDNKSFFAFENVFSTMPVFKNDTIYLNSNKYGLNGIGIDTSFTLKPIKAYQEFWHSWKTFQLNTKR